METIKQRADRLSAELEAKKGRKKNGPRKLKARWVFSSRKDLIKELIKPIQVVHHKEDKPPDIEESAKRCCPYPEIK